MNTADEILDFAITREEEAAAFYRDLAERVNTTGLKNLLISFAKEEEGHRAKLIGIKSGKRFAHAEGDVLDLKISDYVIDAEAHDNMGVEEALTVAIKREQSAVALYNDLATKTDDADLATTFRALAKEEAHHKLRFEMEYDDKVFREN